MTGGALERAPAPPRPSVPARRGLAATLALTVGFFLALNVTAVLLTSELGLRVHWWFASPYKLGGVMQAAVVAFAVALGVRSGMHGRRGVATAGNGMFLVLACAVVATGVPWGTRALAAEGDVQRAATFALVFPAFAFPVLALASGVGIGVGHRLRRAAMPAVVQPMESEDAAEAATQGMDGSAAREGAPPPAGA